ncbi:DUF5680 domain-containing protein [Rhizobium sp. AG855]|uniref:DUF5680 domain-containing protein n=1 Tax=Rhizobium sp. AG855 TaxID=2183898 RepID=UPI000E74D29D|nr:DUF5680 domain-containing protein [Rhizobium sp. AG855]RKE83928.1 hypothetical protein DFO46_0687 [Rhizobium sp. AG855]
MRALEQFIVEAKAASYMGGKAKEPISSRMAAHELTYARGPFRYLDAYYGGTDFIGQEVVWKNGEPIWAMNYYGRILDPERIDGERAGTVIQRALSALYLENRFLGGFSFQHPLGEYVDESVGSLAGFQGVERILVDGRLAYQLDYHGGLIKP